MLGLLQFLFQTLHKASYLVILRSTSETHDLDLTARDGLIMGLNSHELTARSKLVPKQRGRDDLVSIIGVCEGSNRGGEPNWWKWKPNFSAAWTIISIYKELM
jgi:hypothetical protein